MSRKSTMRMTSWIQVLVSLQVILCLFSCANIKPIDGGPIDRIPPSVLPGISTPNMQVNFHQKTIDFTFDEWVTLNNANQNILISPKLRNTPNFKLKGKTFRIELDKNEVLLPNTTYTIYLGDAIQDLTNKNTAANIHFVFSTGELIDSLFIEGKALDAQTLKPIIRAQISLYDKLTDSAFITESPLYLTLTDSSGNFKINHLKSGKYNLYGLVDKNQNYYFDQKTESIAFLTHPINISNEQENNFVLKFSQEKSNNYIKEKKPGNGKIKLQFANPLDQVNIKCSDCKDLHTLISGDSVLIWYSSPHPTSSFVQYDNRIDTIALDSSSWHWNPNYRKIQHYSRQMTGDHEWTLTWFEPILFLDTSKIHFSCSSVFRIQIDSVDERTAKFYFPTTNIDNFKILMDSGAIQGIHNSFSIRDTLNSSIIQSSALSRLSITIDSLVPGNPYVFQILQEEKLIRQSNINPNETFVKLHFNSLPPGKYKARLILDENKNGHWDPCKFANKIQPELIWNWDLKELRADWDMELNVKL